MSETFWLRSVSEDRDLSRAASERYLMLQALSAPSAPAKASRRHRLQAWCSSAAHLVRNPKARRVGAARTAGRTD
jgi:hypothetical protein